MKVEISSRRREWKGELFGSEAEEDEMVAVGCGPRKCFRVAEALMSVGFRRKEQKQGRDEDSAQRIIKRLGLRGDRLGGLRWKGT